MFGEGQVLLHLAQLEGGDHRGQGALAVDGLVSSAVPGSGARPGAPGWRRALTVSWEILAWTAREFEALKSSTLRWDACCWSR